MVVFESLYNQFSEGKKKGTFDKIKRKVGRKFPTLWFDPSLFTSRIIAFAAVGNLPVDDAEFVLSRTPHDEVHTLICDMQGDGGGSVWNGNPVSRCGNLPRVL